MPDLPDEFYEERPETYEKVWFSDGSYAFAIRRDHTESDEDEETPS